MFRLFAWKTGFELQNLKRIFKARKKRGLFYFAFGANLSEGVFYKTRKIRPLSSRDFVLNDFKLCFDHPGPFKGMGFASIHSSPGDRVFGKIYELDPIDFDRLDYYEAVPWLKRYERVATFQEGLEIFYYRSRMPNPLLKPTASYKRKILDSLRSRSDVPPDYIEAIHRLETVPESDLADDLQLVFSPDSTLPKALRRRIERLVIILYVKILRAYSPFERFIT